MKETAPESDSKNAESEGKTARKGDLAFSSERRMVEALLFASDVPVAEEQLMARLPAGTDVAGVLSQLQAEYAGRGVVLARVAGKWMFRTAEDLSFLLHKEVVVRRRLSRAALETLAIIAYHQPVSRAEIEEIRGVSVSKGTLDVLLETGWIGLRQRRRVPGRPVTYGTSEKFLVHFGFSDLSDLPGVEELKAAGLLDSVAPLELQGEPRKEKADAPNGMECDASRFSGESKE